MKSRRLPWLLLALAATAALGALGDPDQGGVSTAAPRGQERVATIRALLPRSAGAWQGGDPFAVAMPAPAVSAPAAAPAVADAAPGAPALPPWRVIGKQQDEDASWTVFLARGEETWVVREGDALDDYRIAAIKPPQLVLQHARRNARRTIDIGSARE